ncbi:isoquinoline 1-oxidoreductase, beta subunit [Salipiger thiooxidans]|uniref:Isoquinoline 1-oxidoreductase, beta subunit n=1 Tax=Salipiger thiooxidans TaxID=282683 RepID=A0A1G7FNK4_9RHOB|nr:hypothetical protein [Salipiger thiooxidans]SDE77434.1 isoquinoline 1-oxidoreductase, beta subunit [Salipiger thiooxidans]
MVYEASGRRAAHGDLAAAAMDTPAPAEPVLKDPAGFRWIGSDLRLFGVRAKSTDRQSYAIDVAVDCMLLAAPRPHATLVHQPGRD